MIDSAGLEVLTEQECFRLLAGVPVGRIVFTDRALPAVQPVNFAVDDRTVIIRTVPHSRLSTAATGAVVAFEADEFADDRVRTAWSVVAVGQATGITEQDEVRNARRLGLQSWTSSAGEHYLRIAIEIISGRRLPAHQRI
jgi:nitroimidazol reductase NimA-like FMN-containing flavoprotein (pyridoxamine 5'-phosphate oxidase superfamily)